MALRALFKGKADLRPLEPVQAEVPQLHEADLAATYKGPRVGGDLYDFIPVHPDGVLFGLFDVAGRAEENNYIVSATQAAFRKRGAALFAKDDLNEADAMMELCIDLNKTILQSAAGVRECPAFAACYREGLGTVCYFNAGHMPGLLLDESGITELPATGLPLGLFSHSLSDANIVALAPGAVLLLVSRGVVEAEWEGAEFGLDRVKKYFLQNKTQNASDLCNRLLAQLQQYRRARKTHNDLTAVALVRSAKSYRIAAS